jgi:hypothetical protein
MYATLRARRRCERGAGYHATEAALESRPASHSIAISAPVPAPEQEAERLWPPAKWTCA